MGFVGGVAMTPGLPPSAGVDPSTSIKGESGPAMTGTASQQISLRREKSAMPKKVTASEKLIRY